MAQRPAPVPLTDERDQLKREAALQRVSDFGQIQALTEERDALRKEVERLKTVPMKYRRMAFNAQLQEENKALWERVETLEKALRGVLPWVVTQVVACNGLKCREAVCMSCDSDAEDNAQLACDAYAAADAAMKEQP